MTLIHVILSLGMVLILRKLGVLSVRVVSGGNMSSDGLCKFDMFLRRLLQGSILILEPSVKFGSLTSQLVCVSTLLYYGVTGNVLLKKGEGVASHDAELSLLVAISVIVSIWLRIKCLLFSKVLCR